MSTMEETKTAATVSRRGFLGGIGAAALGASALGLGLLGGCAPQPRAAEAGGEAAASGDATSPALSQTGSAASPYAQINPQDWDFTTNSIEDFANTTMFSELKIGSLTLKNRLIKSAASSMVPNEEQKAVAYHGRIAAGGMGAVLVEGSYIMLERLDKRVNVADNDMRMTIEESPLAAICAEVHSYDVPCLVQMKTATPGIVYLWENMGEEGETHKASLLSDADIQMYIEDTIDGAERLKAIGFDGIDLNAAGDNLPARFFSRFGNDRDAGDPYGPASIENRTRIACDIIRGIKERCGSDFVVQVLVNGVEENDGSLGDNALVNTPEETVAICQALEAAGADALELRLGTFAFHEAQFVNDGVFAGYGYDGATSFGTFYDFDSHFSGLLDGSHSGCGLIMGACRYVKQHVSIPVGGVVFMDPALAPDYFENALSEGWLDMIYMHRPVANCDAEYANKLREGRIDEIRPCCRCLNCLGGLCRVNPCNNSVFTDAMPEGYEARPADGDKNVMVIGGGPAGMGAARVAAERGYAVTLYEKNGLGGLLDFAEMVKGKHESLGRLRNYLSHMLEVEGVNVVTGQEVDAAFVREQSPDVVIVATGGVRPELAAAGTAATPVIGVTDFLASEVGERVAVLGFNAQATDTAHYLIAQGKKVTVIAPEPAEAFGTGQSMMLNAFVKPAFFAAGGRLMPECTLKSVGDGEIVVTNSFGMDITLACDCVVDASTMSSNTALADELSGEFDVHVIGDAAEPSSIQNAITTGNLTARNC